MMILEVFSNLRFYDFSLSCMQNVGAQKAKNCMQKVGAEKAKNRTGKVVAKRGYLNETLKSIQARNNEARENMNVRVRTALGPAKQRRQIKLAACFPERKRELRRWVVCYPTRRVFSYAKNCF